MTEAISVETHNDIAVVRFIRPKERNPLSIATLEELERQFISLSSRDDIRAIIFTGTEDVFASGANIREVGSLTPNTALAFSRRWQSFFQSLADSKIKTIAAINGYCMGGALDLALSCKVRVATPNAVFAHPGLRLGIITGWGGTQRLSRLIGTARALDIFLTARRVKSDEALEIGLISAVSESVLELAVTFAN
jgi:enoyl-CoA hydratase